MIPGGSRGIARLASQIAQDLVPKAPDAYMAADLGYLVRLLDLISQDYDRVAQVLTSERQWILRLLGEALPHLNSGGLGSRVAQVLEREPASLRAADLAQEADELLKVLIDAHATVEGALQAGEAWAGPLNLQIWVFLDAFVANRVYA